MRRVSRRSRSALWRSACGINRRTKSSPTCASRLPMRALVSGARSMAAPTRWAKMISRSSMASRSMLTTSSTRTDTASRAVSIMGLARVGLAGGYGWANAQSDIGFDLDAKGWNLGLYGEYGGLTGLHAEAFVKHDRYSVEFDDGAFDGLSPDVRSTGVDGAVGYRFPIGGNIVLDAKPGVRHV